MQTIKSVVVSNVRKITLVMACVSLVILTAVQIYGMHKSCRENAVHTFGQVEQILEENSRELERVREEYRAKCLNDARSVAYILEYNPEARDDVEELKKIAADAEVDEIHIFDENGVIIAGTHPEYFGYSFDSGEQMAFFRPLLEDKSLELVQEVMPNTAEGRMVQYSALWSEDRDFILQIGMDPASELRATEKNELSYIFSLLRTGNEYSLYAIDSETGTVVGATVLDDLGKSMDEVGFEAEQLQSGRVFHTVTSQGSAYCMAKTVDENYIIWAMPAEALYESVASNSLLLLAGLVFIALILVYAVSDSMNRTVIDQIKVINEGLRKIQDGDLETKIEVAGSREFLELSAHINGMVESLLQSTRRLELSEQIREQKEELEKQREQLESALKYAEDANNAKSAFLFSMSHDIRTPMNAILGFANLALDSGDVEEQRGYLKGIAVSAHQLLDMFEVILELSKIQNQQITIEENLTNINDVCDKLDTIFEGELKEKSLRYSLDADIAHPYMYMDETHFSQIVLNIISNAVKYTPDGGEITVSLRQLPQRYAGHLHSGDRC